jgi:bacterioferritin
MDNQDFQPDSRPPRGDSRTAFTGAPGRADDGDNVATAIELLIRAQAIAEEAARRCERQYVAALGSEAPALARAALAHASNAETHVRRISVRIGELGGETDVADLTPDATVSPNPYEARLAFSLPALLCRHLMAERDAIRSYSEIASFFRLFDPATWSLIQGVAADTESRKRELSGLLAMLSSS